MRRLAYTAVIAALALTLLVPSTASAAAAPWFRDVERAVCSNTGGAFGFGRVAVRVRFGAFNDWDDPSLPTVNYIKVVSKRQQKVDGVWVTVAQTTTQTAVYPDGSGWLGLTAEMRYAFPEEVHPLTRIVMRGEFWDDVPTGDVRLKTIRVLTKGC